MILWNEILEVARKNASSKLIESIKEAKDKDTGTTYTVTLPYVYKIMQENKNAFEQ